MSHRIIISSSRSSAIPAASTNHADSIATIECNVTFTPSHDQSDKDVLKRVGKILKLMHQIETIVDESSADQGQ